ncbi:MAG: DoxX family protein [Acidobacteriota bacterium]
MGSETMFLSRIRETTDDRLAGGTRILLAIIFLMTGPMKLVVPQLAEAWSGQLTEAQIPFYELSRWAVPFLELFLGVILTIGAFVRPAALVVFGIMIVATYVHVVVDDPSLFPLQPSEPIIPLMVMLGSAYLLWRGGGSWSRDLKSGRQ